MNSPRNTPRPLPSTHWLMVPLVRSGASPFRVQLSQVQRSSMPTDHRPVISAFCFPNFYFSNDVPKLPAPCPFPVNHHHPGVPAAMSQTRINMSQDGLEGGRPL